ncbi:MAG: hypothetical protein ACK5MT_08780 [Actinomycetales bacterium]
MSTHPVAVKRRRDRRRNSRIIITGLVVLLVLLGWAAVVSLESPSPHQPDTVAESENEDLIFTSPDKSVICQLNRFQARCTAINTVYVPPQGCTMGWNMQVLVDTAISGCAEEPFPEPVGPLAFGDDVTRGDLTCQSRAAAMRCLNDKSQHGFSISAKSTIAF